MPGSAQVSYKCAFLLMLFTGGTRRPGRGRGSCWRTAPSLLTELRFKPSFPSFQSPRSFLLSRASHMWVFLNHRDKFVSSFMWGAFTESRKKAKNTDGCKSDPGRRGELWLGWVGKERPLSCSVVICQRPSVWTRTWACDELLRPGLWWQHRMRPVPGPQVLFGLFPSLQLPSLGPLPALHPAEPSMFPPGPASVLPRTSCTCPELDLPRASWWLECPYQSDTHRTPLPAWPPPPPQTHPLAL